MLTHNILFMPISPSERVSSIGVGSIEYGEPARPSCGTNGEWITRRLAGNGHADEHWETVWYTGRHIHTLTLMNGTDDQVYIRGHGTKGISSIQMSQGGVTLDAETVALRLMRSGLPRSFTGKIKCYNCESAEEGDHGEPAFAQVLADAMHEQGYKNCTYFGYFGKIDSHHKKALATGPDSDPLHKYRRSFRPIPANPTVSEQFADGRASANRVQIVPHGAVRRLLNKIR